MTTATAKGRKHHHANGSVPSEILDRQPPFSLEAEKGVLGSLILKPENAAPIAAIVGPRDFHDEANQRLFAHMLAIDAAGRKIDLTLLMERLSTSGDLELIGGPGYLAEIARSVPHAANAEHYANIVREKAGLRRIIHAASDALRGAYSGLPLCDVEGQLQAAIEDIAPQGLKFERLTSSELSATDDRVEYLIDDVWPMGQCGIISAVFKALKTGTAVDAAISLATATPFLGYFPVRRAIRVGLMAIDGVGTIQVNCGATELDELLQEIAAKTAELDSSISDHGVTVRDLPAGFDQLEQKRINGEEVERSVKDAKRRLRDGESEFGSLKQLREQLEAAERATTNARVRAMAFQSSEPVGGALEELDSGIDSLAMQIQQKEEDADAARRSQEDRPAPNSARLKGTGPGEIAKKSIGTHSDWGNLNPRERQEVLQSIGKEYPSHYRDIIEQYFKRLAADDEGASK